MLLSQLDTMSRPHLPFPCSWLCVVPVLSVPLYVSLDTLLHSLKEIIKQPRNKVYMLFLFLMLEPLLTFYPSMVLSPELAVFIFSSCKTPSLHHTVLCCPLVLAADQD